MKALLLSLITLITLSAQAESIPMLDVKSESEPAETGYMNLNVENTNFVSLNFTDVKANRDILITTLNQQKVKLIFKGPIDIVLVSAQSLSANSMILNVHYLYEHKLINSIYKVKKLKMYYVAPSNLYETMDMDTQKVVRHAYAYTRFINGQQKGIERIETW